MLLAVDAAAAAAGGGVGSDAEAATHASGIAAADKSGAGSNTTVVLA